MIIAVLALACGAISPGNGIGAVVKIPMIANASGSRNPMIAV